MPTVNQKRLHEELKQRRRASQRREEEAFRRIFRQEQEETPRRPTRNIIVYEYRCPDCKHKMWTEADIAKSCECSICGFHGAFKKRED